MISPAFPPPPFLRAKATGLLIRKAFMVISLCCRYDYEAVESEAAQKMMKYLREKSNLPIGTCETMS